MPVHVGDRGTAATPLRPQGFVLVNGERFDARAEQGAIDAGGEVIVVAGDHTGLVVRQTSPTYSPTLPDHGKPVNASFGERVTAEAQRQEEERQQWLIEHRQRGTTVGAIVGGVAAAAVIWILWGFVVAQTDNPWTASLVVVLGGCAYGVGVFRLLDSVLGEVDHNFRRVTTASTCLAVVGLFGGAAVGILTLGLPGGVAVAVGSTIVLAAIPPVFVLLTGLGGDG